MSRVPSAEELAGLVDTTRRTLDAAGALLGDPRLEPFEARLRAAEERHGFLGDTVLVALAGGTGSGKSSLLNAMAGEEVARPGVLRPTTSEPFAWVPTPVEPALTRLLDAFGIARRAGHDGAAQGRADHVGLSHLAVIDLPDYDSVEPAHRAVVDRLVPRLDAVVWVVDPEKYNDAVLHDGYLRPLSRWQDQFVFVLNQVDRLALRDVDAVIDDLVASLHEDGIPDPLVLPIAASPTRGEPYGIDDLRDLLHDRFEAKGAARAKLLTDLQSVAAGLVELTEHATAGEPRAPRPDWDATRERAAGLVGEGIVDAAAVEQAARVGRRTAVASAAGPVGRLLHAARRSPAGRLLGLPGDDPVDDTLVDQRRIGGSELDAVGVIREHVTAVSLAVPPSVGRTVRSRTSGEWVEEQVRLASRAARAATSPPRTVRGRSWWPWLAVVQTLVTVTVVAGLVLTFFPAALGLDPTPSGPGPLPHPILLSVAGVVLGLLVRRLAGGSGARAGRSTALAHRAAIAAHAATTLERRIGRPLTDDLAAWDALRAGIADLRTTLERGGT